MAHDWTSKEKIALLSNILEFGDQHESWSAISNDLSRTFQTRKEGYFSIKVCLLFLLKKKIFFIFINRIVNKNINILLSVINLNGFKMDRQMV